MLCEVYVYVSLSDRKNRYGRHIRFCSVLKNTLLEPIFIAIYQNSSPVYMTNISTAPLLMLS